MAVVESDLPSLLLSLPFRMTVPWEEMLVVMDDDKWQAGPVNAMLEAADELGEEGWTKKHELMKKHALDVLWGVEGSRAHLNLLHDAAFKARLNGAMAAKASLASAAHMRTRAAHADALRERKAETEEQATWAPEEARPVRIAGP